MIKLCEARFYEMDVLKQLALLGGMHDYTTISSRELGQLLGISQQSASNRLLKLLHEGMILRHIGGRKPRVILTMKGIDLLRKDYSLYKKMFEAPRKVMVRGIVTTGLAEGHYYINLKGYREQFGEKLKFVPQFGTLNLRLTGGELTKLEILKQMDGFSIKGFQMDDRTFGDVKCFRCKIKKINCGVIIPARSHHSDMLEVISNHNLRRKLNLTDGDVVELAVNTE